MFIRELEGFSLTGYVPTDDDGKVDSGVTVATGIDLGARSLASLSAAGVEPLLRQKLQPYVGRRGKQAIEILSVQPLELTHEEANHLDVAVINASFKVLERSFNATARPMKLSELPGEIQTVVFSVFHQYGNLKVRTPKFWKQITTGAWELAVENLNNFSDGFPTRRKKEAALMLQGIKKLNGEQENG